VLLCPSSCPLATFCKIYVFDTELSLKEGVIDVPFTHDLSLFYLILTYEWLGLGVKNTCLWLEKYTWLQQTILLFINFMSFMLHERCPTENNSLWIHFQLIIFYQGLFNQ